MSKQESEKSPKVALDNRNPKWLKAELFEGLLKETIPNYRNVKHFEVEPGCAAGENYATIMLRVKIDVQLKDGATKSVSYMMKVPPGNEQFKEMMRKHNIFDVEYKMYHEIVPDFNQLYRNVNVDVKFSAKCYDLKTPSEFGVILLEDLRPFGYRNADRLEGLDLVHTKAVLERLAQWHAASATRVEIKGAYSQLLQGGWHSKSRQEAMRNFTMIVKKPFLDSVKTLEGNEVYIESLTKAVDNITDELFRIVSCDENEFKVLNHGDFWCNNVMFKYDSEGKIEDTLLIDYQMLNYGPPARDLHYFLMSSTSYELKVNCFDYFIEFYHENLVKNLKLLNYPKKCPTLKELHISLIKNSIRGVLAAVGVMAAALLESHDDASLDGFFSQTEDAERFRHIMFTNPRYRKHLQMLLPWMYNRGAFEV
ncbi:uncharacterized protein LOC101457774 [Ceratitis capitata]|uniref:uncharacterized protein LOC101457774 n=1 Tax=Ceratitis capitata TaxID=7213 RepID=UPI000329C41D|nr:uncharacterized protein LOC101457774 [Ceratitis capitata]